MINRRKREEKIAKVKVDLKWLEVRTKAEKRRRESTKNDGRERKEGKKRHKR